jgi:hypothetical protein
VGWPKIHRWQDLGFDFWLVLPLAGLLFVAGGEWVTGQALSRPRRLEQPLAIRSQQQATLALDILSIQAEIRRRRGYTKVEVTTTNPHLRKLEFEFPELDPDRVAAQIAQELGLTPDQVQRLTRYSLD